MTAEPLDERERTVASVISAAIVDSGGFALVQKAVPSILGAQFTVQAPAAGLYGGKQYEITVAELSSERALTSATAEAGITLRATVEVDWDKITNAVIGFVESRCDWASTFIPAEDAETAGIVQGLRDQKANIWYSEPRFWRLGGTAVLHYDLATEEEGNDNGRFNMTLAAIIQGLSKMAAVAPRHFADLVAENDDAITHDVFVQCCVFGEIIYG